MSLLMDALRKAEEAKKKAELESKSKPVAAGADATAKKADDDSLDIALEIGSPSHLKPLLDDLAAGMAHGIADAEIEFASAKGKPAAAAPEPPKQTHSAHTADIATWLETADAVAGRGAQKEPAPVKQAPDYTRAPGPAIRERTVSDAAVADTTDHKTTDSHSAVNKPAAHRAASQQPVASKPTLTTTDTNAIDYVPASKAAAASSWSAEPVFKARPADSITQRIRAQQNTKEQQEDNAVEDKDRRSARSVFAAKRGSAPLKKNLQLAAISITAVLMVASGIYFYINLRTSSLVALPAADPEFQQSQRVIDEARFAAEDAGQAVAQIESQNPDSATTDTVEISPVAADTVELNPIASNPIAETLVETASIAIAPAQISQDEVAAANAPAIDVQPPNTDAPQASAPQASTPEVAAIAPSQSATTNAPMIPQQPVSTSVAASPLTTTSSAATLQPELIEPVTSVSFTRRTSSPASNPILASAYSAYQGGDQEGAERLYREALVSAPLNRSALLGLAAIAANRNNTVEALELYSRLLARDPTDPIAKAGLLDIMPRGNLQEQEVELRRLQRENPDIAPLSYAVGNFMAAQQRWSEAQQAYFVALQLAKNNAQGMAVNPDYSFNLAVSLEHLGQSRPAVSYYREALLLAENHPASFDLAIVAQRLDSLESASNE